MPASRPHSQPPKLFLKKLPRILHVLLYIRLQMPRPRLPVVRRISDAARQEDEFVRIRGREDQIFSVSPHHPQPVDQHPKKQVGFSEILTVLPADNPVFDQPRQRLHGIGRAEERVFVAMHDLEILDGVLDIDNPAGTEFDIDRATFDQLFQLLPS